MLEKRPGQVIPWDSVANKAQLLWLLSTLSPNTSDPGVALTIRSAFSALKVCVLLFFHPLGSSSVLCVQSYAIWKVFIIVRASIAVIKHHGQKQLGNERVHLAYNFRVTLHHWWALGLELKGRKELGTRAEAEIMKECCSLACFPWLVQPPFLYNSESPT